MQRTMVYFEVIAAIEEKPSRYWIVFHMIRQIAVLKWSIKSRNSYLIKVLIKVNVAL